jgi:hypothetical protein
MKKILRQIIGFIVVSPFILLVYITAIFVGKEKAIKTWGSSATFVSKLAIKSFVPNIKNADEFDSFASGMKANFWFVKAVYDFDIAEDNKNIFKLHIWNCPFCECLNVFGLSGLEPYVCEGDWVVAKDNIDKWDFERKHQIGTGDSFCDHTYKRKKKA